HQCHGLVPQAEAIITSIDWPSASVTYAFFQSLRRPWRFLKAFALPFTFTVFTAMTLTEKICSIAAFTSALVAVFAISKTYWLETSCKRAVFSDTRGARITSYKLVVLMPATPRSS